MILAFDVYGTLIDISGAEATLTEFLGERAAQFNRVWRAKQLEYTFRRALMRDYVDFAVCTAQALEHTSLQLGLSFTGEQRKRLVDTYRSLPAFADAAQALAVLHSRGVPCYAFSNGLPDAVHALLEQAGVLGYLSGIVSTHEIKSFKPDPATYEHFLRRSGASSAADTMLISGNSFDLLGAINCGWSSTWLRRSADQLIDPWGAQPARRISTLTELLTDPSA